MQTGPTAKNKEDYSAIDTLAKLYRYVFFRVSRNQRRRIADQGNADINSLALMGISPMGLVATVYWCLYRSVGIALHLDTQRMWMYGFAVLGSILIFNYITIGRKKTIDQIHIEFSSSDSFGKWGTWIVTAYFVIPLITFFGALVLTAR